MRPKETKPFPYYPIFLKICGKKCIVIGGGEVALRKVRMLLESGADVTVISPTLHPGLTELVGKKTIHLVRRSYQTGDLRSAAIVIAATDRKKTNHKVAADARKTGALVNVVDDSGPSDFIVPSSFRKGELTIAVSTGGTSPALARKLRTRLEKDFGEEFASLLSLIGEIRSTLREKGIKVDAETWQEALDLDLLIPLAQPGHFKRAKTVLLDRLKAARKE